MFINQFKDTHIVTIHDSSKEGKLLPFKVGDKVPEGHGVFFTVNGCTGRRLKENLTHVNGIFVDFDFKNVPELKQFLLDIDELPTATYIVRSKNGYHCYWLLDEPLVVNDSNRDQLIKTVEGMQRQIAVSYGSDAKAIDVLHLLRLPGYEHRKDIANPFNVEIVSDDSDTTYTLPELTRAIPPLLEEEQVHTPSTSHFDIKQVVTDVWAEKGHVASFNKMGQLIVDDILTATFIGRQGDGNYIATTSTEYPAQGNATTYVAGTLGISTGDAYKWLGGRYGFPEVATPAVTVEDVFVIECPERARYLKHLSGQKWDDKDWVATLKALTNNYFINFYKQVAIKYPYLKYEIGRTDTFWNYKEDEGLYYELAQSTMAGIVIRLLREDEMDAFTTDSQVKRIILNFTAYEECGVKLDDFSLPVGWLHVCNGWLDLKSNTLFPHTPKKLSLFKMDANYDIDATCPLYDKFLDVDVQMAVDQVRVIDQFSGYILTDEITQHSSLILEGRKGCGKSMLTEIWMNILGKKAVTLQLTSLQNGGERFIGQTLAHKNLVWFDEANPKTTNINEFFQNLITGEKIRIERKGVQGDDYVRNTLKVILSLNEMPDHMPTGMDRRYRHITFHRSFYEEGIVDVDYKRKVLENEKSGVLNRMLRGLADLRKMGGLTSISGEEERKREYTLTSDDFSSFLSDHFNPVAQAEGITRYTYKELRDAFVVEYPKSYNKQLTVRGFNKKLLATRLPEFKYLTTGKSDGQRGYKGIKLKQGHELPTTEFEPIRTTYEIEKDDF